MSMFDEAMRSMTYADEIGQDNKVLCADISKLTFIAKSIKSEYGDIVKGVYITPANIIQTPFEKLGEVEILIHVDYSVDAMPSDIPIHEFCSYYLKSEYKELKVSDIKVVDNFPKAGSYLCIYTENDLFLPDLLEFTDEEILMLSKLLSEERFMVEICKGWNNERSHTFLIHVQKQEEYLTLVNCIPYFGDWYGIPFTEATSKSKFVAVPVIGFDKLPYDIPYEYIYRDDLDLQRIETLLKEQEEI